MFPKCLSRCASVVSAGVLGCWGAEWKSHSFCGSVVFGSTQLRDKVVTKIDYFRRLDL